MRGVEVDVTMTVENKTLQALVYCPICTHTVEAEVVAVGQSWSRKPQVVGGQKCGRCSTPLDAAYVLDVVGGLHG